MANWSGLSASEVLARRACGQGNNVRLATSRSYLQILVQNVFNFINAVMLAIGLVLILLGQAGDAAVTAGLVLMNVLISMYQEGRAKQKLDQIALLSRPKATVVRDGQERTVDPGEVVLGDVLVVRPGDAIVVDGQVLEGTLEVDEALLTGESDLVPKRAGDSVYSGTFGATGSGLYEAQRVGAESNVYKLTAQARAFRRVKTPLQRDIDRIIRILVVLVAQLGVLLAISFAMHSVTLVDSVRDGAVIVGLVPQGLYLMITVSYAMGAMRVAGRGALIQQANAVESTSNVDVLCLDKTGTLTANRIRLEAVCPVAGSPGMEENELRRLLGDYAASTPAGNRTLEALREACPGQARPLHEQVSFSSERKWSALSLAGSGTYVLGAPEVLQPYLQSPAGLASQIDGWVARGLRVLLFAHRPDGAALHDAQGQPVLPTGMQPLGLVALSDELRPEARETLRRFADLGVRLKIISGDDPRTVAAVARQAGMQDLRLVWGSELAAMDDAQFERAVEQATIFGRTTPQQKERLVQALGRRGHHVAMIGDGVNDVLSLKQAHLGIAMQSGSAATRSVADMVLLGDSFAVLPVALREGQRIVKGMEDVVRLLLTRTLYVLLLIVATQIVGLAFPVTPKHNSILATLTVGIPILAIAGWARPGRPPRSVIGSTRHFVFPAAFTVSLIAMGVYIFYLQMSGDLLTAQTALTTASILCGLVLIPFVEPPTAWWVGGDEMSGDRRPALLALGMLVLYGAVVSVPPLRAFFELTLLRWFDYLGIAALVAAWAVLQRYIWRGRFFERLLGLEDGR
jgi:cation-transporting ATPase E